MTDYPEFDFTAEEIESRDIISHRNPVTERSVARRLALQALYEIDSVGHLPQDVLTRFISKDGQSISSTFAEYFLDDEETVPDLSEYIEIIPNEGLVEQRIIAYFQRLVLGVTRLLAPLDKVLHAVASDFPIEQLAITDRNTLRIALFEIGMVSDVPLSVAIDESVELAKTFGADNSARFINGVLGTIADNLSVVQRILGNESTPEDTTP